jgi:hypothetical protein
VALQEAAPKKNVKINRNEKNERTISLYSDGPASPQSIAIGIKKLQVAFPKMASPFFDLLAERIDANDFTERRLKEAVNHVIDNFRYKELNISDVITFDQRAKLYTGSEFVNAQMHGVDCSEFQMKEIDGIKFWIQKKDLIKTRAT